MVPSPEAKMPEKKLPVNGYGRSGGEFRPAPSPAGAPGRSVRDAVRAGSGWRAGSPPSRSPRPPLPVFFSRRPAVVLRPPHRRGGGERRPGRPRPASRSIYTVDAARSWAESIAVPGDRIVFVGADRDVAGFIGPQTRVVDLGGRFVLPGFHDRHIHPVSGGVELTQCDLNASADRNEVLARLRACVAALGDRPWLVGGGWDLTLFPGGVADRRDLDAILPDRPAAPRLGRRALELGEFEGAGARRHHRRDPRSRGRADRTGRRPARRSAPCARAPPTWSTNCCRRRPLPSALAGLRLAVAKAHGFGIVALTEASAGPETTAAYDALDRAGELGLRVVVSQHLDPEEGPAGIPALVAERAAAHGPHVRATAVKLFADGVIEGGTAALLEPYIGGRTGLGIPNWSADALKRSRRRARPRALPDPHPRHRRPGDPRHARRPSRRRARANGARDARPLLAHIQLFAPSDIPRFRELGVVADFQPLWAFEDSYIRDLTAPFLGPERMRWNYPLASMARTGAVLAAGSDWSVSSMNPLEAIEVAITRCDPELATCDKPWIPEERVDLATMLAAYTIGGAYAGFEERDSGSLEAGKLADLVVLDRNLFAIPAGEISEASVLLTLFEGKTVHGSLDSMRAEAAGKGGL